MTDTPRNLSPVLCDSIETYERPHIILLTDGIYAVCFSLMKLLPARHMIDQGIASGFVTPGTHIIETTSGTLGLGLAMVCAMRGLRLTIVTDPVVDRRFRNKLEALGAEIDIVDEPSPYGGYQQARLDRLALRSREIPDSFVPRQYDNPGNPASYTVVAEHLHEQVGHVDHLVGCVGSGGSMCGIARRLRELSSPLQVHGIDTHGSMLFGMQDRPRTFRGLGNSLMPANLDHTTFDTIHWVNLNEAARGSLDLLRHEALFRGPTSGAAYLVGSWIKARHPSSSVAVIMPDEGERYLDTVYDPLWRELHASGAAAETPSVVTTPAQAQRAGTWSVMRWQRRNAWQTRT